MYKTRLQRQFITIEKPTRGVTSRKWQIFQELLTADDIERGTLRYAYVEACSLRGQWVATPPVMNWRQFLRALIGLSWRPETPQMAVRLHSTLPWLEFTPDATAIKPELTKLTWWQFISRRWRVEWV